MNSMSLQTVFPRDMLEVNENGSILKLCNKIGEEIGYFDVSTKGGGMLTTSDKTVLKLGAYHKHEYKIGVRTLRFPIFSLTVPIP